MQALLGHDRQGIPGTPQSLRWTDQARREQTKLE